MDSAAKHETGQARRRRLPGRFARSEKGATIVEFAIVGPMFFAIVGATIETALTFFAAYALDTAVIDSSRAIKTGQYGFNHSADSYREALCSKLYGIFDCGEIRIAVKEIDDFGSYTPSQPIDPANGEWSVAQVYEGRNGGPITGNTTVMVEAYYKWPTIFNIPGLHVGLTPDGKRLLAAAHVFKTEAYPS